MKFSIVLVVAFALAACSKPAADQETRPDPAPVEGPQETAPEPESAPSTAPTTQGTQTVTDAAIDARVAEATKRLEGTEAGRLILASINAHGGLDAWFKGGDLKFRFTYHPIGKDPNDTRQTVDIWSSRAVHNVVDKEVSYGWDGQQAWLKPADANAGTNPRFWSLTPFYFVAIPFVLADPGTVLESAGTQEFEGVQWELVKASFEAGVGDAPDDFYVVYIHPETRRVGGVRYIVSYPGFFPDGGHSPEKWMSYDGAQEVGGITFPETFRTFEWDGKTHGELKTNTKMHEVSWVPRGETSFEVPEAAKVLEGF